MAKKPSRLYDAQFMADAAQAHAALQAQALKVAPHAFGPMARIPMQLTPPATEIETLPAHCFTCKGKTGESKSEFDVDPTKTRTMPNGAILKQGTCKADGCTQTLSAFTAGVKDGQ